MSEFRYGHLFSYLGYIIDVTVQNISLFQILSQRALGPFFSFDTIIFSDTCDNRGRLTFDTRTTLIDFFVV